MIDKIIIKWHSPVDSNPDQQQKKNLISFCWERCENLFYKCFYFYKLFPVIFIYRI